jgi:hypothetical protein
LIASADQYAGTISDEFTVADWRKWFAQVMPIVARVNANDSAFVKFGLLGSGFTAPEQVAVDQAFTRRALTIVSHLSAATIVGSIPRRLAYLWGTADPYPPGRTWSRVAHGLAQLQYGLLLVLMFVGIAVRRGRFRRDWPVWIVAAYLTALHLVSHVEGRYTLPARPALFMYVGVAVAAIVGWIRRDHRARIASRETLARLVPDGRQ